ncbi:hypothetical protein ACN47E_006020 [Coniothyrium glycines]
MMLTSSFFATPMPHYSPYSPPRPSPLSQRSANVPTRSFDFNTMSQSNERKAAVPQRAYKPNPVVQTRDAATKRRRDMFFKRVQNSREDKKWEARGEQIQQLDFVSERKRWEAEKARQAPPENDDFDEEVMEDADLPAWSSKTPQHEDGMTEVDYIAAQEEYELQELIASMEQENDVASQHYGSDDDDYDSIFMDCANLADGHYQQTGSSSGVGNDHVDTMDMDMDMDMADD